MLPVSTLFQEMLYLQRTEEKHCSGLVFAAEQLIVFQVFLSPNASHSRSGVFLFQERANQ